MMAIQARIHKILVRIANREDPDQTASSKVLNTFLVLFSNKMMAIKTRIHKMLVRIANREDPDQTVSSEAV